MRSLIALVLLTVAMTPHGAFACSCGSMSGDIEADVSRSFERATIVVAAEARTVSAGENRGRICGNGPCVTTTTQFVTWEVLEVWKGSHLQGHVFESKTETACCMCGVAVERGEMRVLYLDGHPPYEILSCGAGGPLKSSLKEIPVLYRLSEGR